jgi:hypothetical protein
MCAMLAAYLCDWTSWYIASKQRCAGGRLRRVQRGSGERMKSPLSQRLPLRQYTGLTPIISKGKQIDILTRFQVPRGDRFFDLSHIPEHLASRAADLRHYTQKHEIRQSVYLMEQPGRARHASSAKQFIHAVYYAGCLSALAGYVLAVSENGQHRRNSNSQSRYYGGDTRRYLLCGGTGGRALR